MTGPPCYKLYSPSGSFFAFAPLIAAEFTGIPVTVETNGIEQSIALKSPTGKAPILETQQGEVIYSSRSISRFIAGLRRDTSLLGNGSLRQTSAIEDWMNWAQQEIELPATILYYFVSGFLPLNEEA
ncbi:MAG: glutathione S-transferase [Bacillariaceae sp.]|jgi:glutathione S-transferase